MSIQELIENIDSNIKLIRVWEKESVHPGMANAHRQHANNLEEKKALIQTLQSEHKAEIEALERKAWECSVEMMERSDIAYSKEIPSASILTAYKRNGEGRAWKNASRKLRQAFGFPKSETPERFKK